MEGARGYALPSGVRAWVVILALVPLAAAAYHRVQVDDPYITYRYARNLAEGGGFVYNAGERVLGTTAPLHALLLALGGRVTDDFPVLSSAISGIALAALGLLIHRILAGFGDPLAGAIAAVLVVLNPLLGDAFGFELNLFLAFVFGAYASHFAGRAVLAALLLGLATLTRGDGLVPAALILSHVLWTHGRRVWVPLLIYGAIVGTWAVYATVVFGSPFPNTLAAKRALGESGLWRPFWFGALRMAYLYLRESPFYLWFGVTGVMGCLRLVEMDRRIWLIVAWVALVFIAYTAMGIPAAYNYYAGMVPLLMIVSGFGVVHLSHLVLHQWPGWGRRATMVVLAVLFPLLAADLTPSLRHLDERPEPRYWTYREVGEWLASETSQDASVGLIEIGIVGYYSGRRIVDMCGLVSPDASPHIAQGDVTWPIRVHRPDYVLLHDPVWKTQEEPVASSAWFQRDYEQVRTFDGTGDYRVAVYRRKSTGVDAQL